MLTAVMHEDGVPGRTPRSPNLLYASGYAVSAWWQAYARVERPGSSSSRRDEGLTEAPPYAVFKGAADFRP